MPKNRQGREGYLARMTLMEAADHLGVSTKTLRLGIKEGGVHADIEDGKYYLSSIRIKIKKSYEK